MSVLISSVGAALKTLDTDFVGIHNEADHVLIDTYHGKIVSMKGTERLHVGMTKAAQHHLENYCELLLTGLTVFGTERNYRALATPTPDGYRVTVE